MKEELFDDEFEEIDEETLMKVNIFTGDLEILFKLEPEELNEELELLDLEFHKNNSIRAASLLVWYYLLGNYENP